MNADQLIVWIIIGGLAGSLAGMVVKRDRRGFGTWGNLGIGLVGAVIGGILFDALDITIGQDLQITLGDLIAAFTGSLVLLIALTLYRRR